MKGKQVGTYLWKRIRFIWTSVREDRPALLGDLLLDRQRQREAAVHRGIRDERLASRYGGQTGTWPAKGDGPQRSAWVTPFWSGRTRNGRKVVTVGPEWQ